MAIRLSMTRRSRRGLEFSDLQLLGFLIAVAYWPGLSFGAVGSRWTVLCVALPIMLCLHEIRPTRYHFGILALIGWGFFSLMWTPVGYDGIFALIQLITICGCFCLGSVYPNLGGLYRGMGLGLIVSSGLCILQAMHYEPVQIVADGSPPPGLFINPDMLGELCIVVLIALLLTRQYWIATLTLPALILSQSRTAMVAGAICALVYVVRSGRLKWLWALPLPILMIYAIAPYKWAVNPTGGGRIDLWLDTIQGLSFWGHGIGSYYSTFIVHATHLDAFHYQPDVAHNELLQTAFELGIPATLLALYLVVALWKNAGETEQYLLLAFAAICMLAFPLHNPATAALFGVVAGHSSRARDNILGSVDRGGLPLYKRGKSAYLNAIRKRGSIIPLFPRV